MLTSKQILEIKDHLEKAQNPLFFYDNDCDGLCSFLLLRRWLGRGKGVAVRSYPDLDSGYARKVQELNADYVFILDKPVVSREFFEIIGELHLPIVWIDHHDVGSKELTKEFKNIYLYNWTLNEEKNKSEEPVTYWCFKLSEREEDIWLAVIGCIADHYLPDFSNDFAKRFGEFWMKNIKEPFDAYYGTEIGRIAQSINFGLKDSTSNIVRLQNFLIGCNGPNEVLLEATGNYSFRKKNQEIRKKYNALLERAKNFIEGNILFFEYSGDLSISADIANELSYLFKNKYVAVAYKKGVVTNISMRGDNVREILERILKRFDNASGGGHENAVGARIQTNELKIFKEIMKVEVGNGN